MAQLLSDRDSTDRHLSAARRCQRLCRRLNAAPLAEALEPARLALIAAQKSTKEKLALREEANDEALLADSLLDDQIRTVSEACKRHDRQDPTAQTYPHVFPDGSITSIITAPREREIELAEELVIRIQALGAEHPLAPEGTALEAAIIASTAAEAAYAEAIRAEKGAEATEELAQAALRAAYEHGYLNARKQYGKVFAERTMPKLRTRSKPSSSGGTAA